MSHTSRLRRAFFIGAIGIGSLGLAACHHAKTARAPGTGHSVNANDGAADDATTTVTTPITENETETARFERLRAERIAAGEVTDRLTAFASNDELIAFLKKRGSVSKLTAQGNMWGDAIGDAFGAGGLGLSGVGEGGGGQGQGIGLGSVGTIGHGAGISANGATSITNTQHANVDEGGIVKLLGDKLVVLRRGRIFILRASDLSLVSKADAYGPGIDPSGAWYDEMLVHENKIIVIGYSYNRGGTEIGVFNIDSGGVVAHRATYQLRSGDYYSSRNYASRLIGNKLVFYSPLGAQGSEVAPLGWLPAFRRWKPGATDVAFANIIDPSRIYRPMAPAPGYSLMLHTVTVCDLSKPDMTCDARGIMGPPGRVFYVSPTAVYVWLTPMDESPAPKTTNAKGESTTPLTPGSIVHRLPLDGSSPTVLSAKGGPVDSFSFLEADGQLNVLVRADTGGDGMWSPESAEGEVALMRVPLGRFTSTRADVPSTSYRRLPTPVGETMQNRFVGEFLLYGTGTSWGRPRSPDDGRVFTQRFAGKDPTATINLGHGVDRIEAMGNDAVVIGADKTDLHFSPISLRTGTRPAMGIRYTKRNATQGELRSHGFFYRPDGLQKGLFGLPVRGGGAPGYKHLVDGSAAIQFVKNDGLVLHDVGSLDTKPRNAREEPNDNCKASCVDWYGNARPIFLGDRVLALLGYEIVEGKLDPTSGVREVRRASFMPIPKSNQE